MKGDDKTDTTQIKLDKWAQTRACESRLKVAIVAEHQKLRGLSAQAGPSVP